jgi:hypothetical protein
LYPSDYSSSGLTSSDDDRDDDDLGFFSQEPSSQREKPRLKPILVLAYEIKRLKAVYDKTLEVEPGSFRKFDSLFRQII